MTSVENSMPGPRPAQPVEKAPYSVDRVAALHSRQHRVRSRLQGKVDLRADLRFAPHHVDDALGHVARMRGGKPDATDSLDRAEARSKSAKSSPRRGTRSRSDRETPPLETPPRRLLDLLEQARQRQAALAAAHVGHDAERAELVAAPHRGHPGPHPAAARRARSRRRSPRGRGARRSPGPPVLDGPGSSAIAGIRQDRAPDRGTAAAREAALAECWAMQPSIPMRTPGSRSLCGNSWASRPTTRSSACSRIAQVFTRITSASDGDRTSAYPCRASWPSTSSLSARFIWQP